MQQKNFAKKAKKMPFRELKHPKKRLNDTTQ